jgi:saccharopine dehydrogenase-like NADP-dependent oxidoreductase
VASSSKAIVILGGYGNFGARIARALALDANLNLIVAGRNLSAATKFAESLSANVTGALLDVSSSDLAQQLQQLNAGLVIHTAGPFQGQQWQVPQAVAAASAHYIDLADGRRWVCDFPAALHTTFAERNLVAITGASTVPALSSAVVDDLSQQLSSIEGIHICIAPAQQAPRGVATLQSVLSYCGEPIQVWRNGRWTDQPGWANPQWVDFPRMQRRRGALCDIPDLELFPARYSQVKDVMFRAALEVGTTQWMFAALSALRRWQLTSNLRGLAATLNKYATVFDRFGTPLGGMVVQVKGKNLEGQSRTLSWHIAADDHHGPEIPCMAAIILARRFIWGDAPPPGAYPCMGLIALSEFKPEFAKWGMVVDLIETIER